MTLAKTKAGGSRRRLCDAQDSNRSLQAASPAVVLLDGRVPRATVIGDPRRRARELRPEKRGDSVQVARKARVGPFRIVGSFAAIVADRGRSHLGGGVEDFARERLNV